MPPACVLCRLSFERAQGYWGYFLLWTRFGLSTTAQFAIWIPFLLVFPLWFFRYSRSLWLALEFYLNPEP